MTRLIHCMAMVAATATLTLAAALPSFAFEQNTCIDMPLDWSEGRTSFNYSTTSFPTGSGWANVVPTAVGRVNQNPSKFRMTARAESGIMFFPNGRNEIYGTDPFFLDGAPAKTLYWAHCIPFFGVSDLAEADILMDFSGSVPWTPLVTKAVHMNYGGTKRPVLNTLLHELGHTFPIAHTASIYNIMGMDWNFLTVNGSLYRPYIGEDAANALLAIYGPSTTVYEDLSVTHWKRTGAHAGYSWHDKTVITNTDGSERPTTTVAGETAYIMEPGRPFRIEVTLENNGRNTKSAQLGVMLSSDSNITPSDRILSTNPVTLVRDVPYTTQITATLPSSVTPGIYYLGAYVDLRQTVGEAVENNNATYLPIRVQ